MIGHEKNHCLEHKKFILNVNQDLYFSNYSTDRNGADFTTHQDTPVAAYRQDTYVVFNVDVHIQKTLDSLPPGKPVHKIISRSLHTLIIEIEGD